MSEEQESVHHKPQPSRALVAVNLSPERGGNSGTVRPLATFVAQMVACHARIADYRQHRRAAPEAASALYATGCKAGQKDRFERIL